MTTLFDETSAALGSATETAGTAGESFGEGGKPVVPALLIYVFGVPAPQGSKSGFAIKKGQQYTGKVAMKESSKKVKPWRQDVVARAIDATEEWMLKHEAPWVPLDGPLVVRMVFSFERPKGHYGTGRNSTVLKDWAPRQPFTTPDLDKLARACCDALQTAGVVKNDSCIAEFERLAKVYVGEDPEALATTGCRIEIRRL